MLGIARPDLTVTLVEPLLRRTTYLAEVIARLGLDNVEVVRGRAEELHGRRRFAIVTSRAVAPLERLLGWSMPLVELRGALVAMKWGSLADEIAAAAAVLSRLGCAHPERLELGAGILSPPTVAVRVAWADPRQVVLSEAHRGGVADRRMSRGRRGTRS